MSASEGWATFIARPLQRAEVAAGRRLPLREVRANSDAQDVWRLHDGRVETSWTSGPQSGGEQIDVQLEDVQGVGAVVLRMGSCPVAFPRELTLETSTDGLAWSEVWRGATSVATVRAALKDPADVLLTLPIGPVAARFIRLRQTARAPKVSWCISELSIHRPR